MPSFPSVARIAALAAFCSAPSIALADDVPCGPNLGNVTIDGNVLVSTACRLDGTVVKGNVLLYAGGSLIARDATVEGSIQADTADFVDVESTRVNGNIQLDGLVGDRSTVVQTSVGGSIQLNDNRTALAIQGNDVNGDVQAFDNSGGVLIADNTVDGNLQCKTNAPAPVGGGNAVQGNKEDQCANLQPGTSGSVSTTPTAGADTGASAGGGSGGGSLHWLSVALLLTIGALRRATRPA